jgi:hypothetical protein
MTNSEVLISTYQKLKRLTILVASCDKYADLWRPFSILFKKYWPDCPYDVNLITESPASKKELIFNNVIACGRVGWGDRLAGALEHVKTPYVLLLCDDYFLCDCVENAKMEHLLDIAEKYGVGNLRLLQNPKHSAVFSSEEKLGVYTPKTAYCIASQAGIWNTEFLKRLAKGCNSIWEFERLGSYRNDLDLPILGTQTMEFPFEDVVHKGKWENFGIRLCERNGIALDLSRRKPLANIDYLRKHLKGAILDLNPGVIVKLQNVLTQTPLRLKR